jgi:hypothetical protein
MYHVLIGRKQQILKLSPSLSIHKTLYHLLNFVTQVTMQQYWFTYSAESVVQSLCLYYHSCNCSGHSLAKCPAVDNQYMSHLFQPKHTKIYVLYLTAYKYSHLCFIIPMCFFNDNPRERTVHSDYLFLHQTLSVTPYFNSPKKKDKNITH